MADEVTGFVAVLTDITARKRAEEALAERERAFTALIENSPDVVLRIDRNLRHLYVNPAVEAAFGIQPAQLIGKTIAEHDITRGFAKTYHRAAREVFATGDEQSFNVDLDFKGEARHFSGRLLPEFDRHGNVESVLSIIYDETERTLNEAERNALLAREKAAREQAEDAARARDEFIAVVSHELRSPLNGIQNWTHVLENQLVDQDPGVERALAGIKLGVQQQVKLIDDLLDATLLMTGKLQIHKHPVVMRHVIQAGLEQVQPLLNEKNIGLVQDIQLHDEQVIGDAGRLQQVIWNLLSNAVKFTPTEGTIWLCACVQPPYIKISVRDNGKGVDPKFLTLLFDAFQQADGSRTRKEGGLGLGLTLAQRITSLHDGRIGVISEGEESGATFVLELPLLENREPKAISHERFDPSNSEIPLPSLIHLHVMVVDDQSDARESLAILLTQAGARVTVLSSGTEARALLKGMSNTQWPDVLICDVAMPGEDGYQTIQKIRAWEAEHNISRDAQLPAIALTAFTQSTYRVRALSNGFHTHLTKPVAPTELIIVVATLVGRA